MRKKKHLHHRMEQAAHLLEVTNHKDNWLNDYPAYDSLFIELGCGKGLFTVRTAASEPGALLVALERISNAMVIAMERAASNNIRNIRFLRADALNICELFGENEADRIYINFCDPWPAKRHEKRRLTSPLFLERYKNVLKPGGEIHFKTDNLSLFRYSLEQFNSMGYELSELTENLHESGISGHMTDYEERFHAENKPVCKLVARLEKRYNEVDIMECQRAAGLL